MKNLAALLLVACAHMTPQTREQLQCNDACLALAGTMWSGALQSAYPMPGGECACSLTDSSIVTCSMRRHRSWRTTSCWTGE